MKFLIANRIILFLSVSISLCSCKEKIFTGNVDCDKCYDTEYDSVDLNVDVTINDKYPRVPIVLFRENVEENQVDWVDTAYADKYYVRVAVDQKYSVRLEYAYNSDTTYVVDGTTVKMKRVSDACDNECWVIVNDNIDGRLKYK